MGSAPPASAATSNTEKRRYAALSWVMTAFGLVCCAIGMAHIILGPGSIPGSVPVNATMDSEDRFYGTYFLAWGLAVIWASCDLSKRGKMFDLLMSVFFAAGVARLVSAAVVGLPNALFVFLGSIELIFPPLVWWWRRALQRGQVSAA